MDNYLQQILNHKRFGVGIVSSGTTGDQKLIHRSPDNLKACNEIAIQAKAARLSDDFFQILAYQGLST